MRLAARYWCCNLRNRHRWLPMNYVSDVICHGNTTLSYISWFHQECDCVTKSNSLHCIVLFPLNIINIYHDTSLCHFVNMIMQSHCKGVAHENCNPRNVIWVGYLWRPRLWRLELVRTRFAWSVVPPVNPHWNCFMIQVWRRIQVVLY